MSKKEKIPLHPGTPKNGDQPDEQIIIDLMEKRKLQQDALKKIITSMDKSSEDTGDTNASDTPKPAKPRRQDQTKLI
ncbi:MAG TPA: hypothetical protein VK589_30570 [Chryseolinea sp.]|nr:hypothetical protein [Chryseolinea sp.]